MMYEIKDFFKRYFPIGIIFIYFAIIMIVIFTFQVFIDNVQANSNQETAFVFTISLLALLISFISLLWTMMQNSIKGILDSNTLEKQIKYLNERNQKIYIPIIEIVKEYEENNELDEDKLKNIISNRFLLNKMEKEKLVQLADPNLSSHSIFCILQTFKNKDIETEILLERKWKDLLLSLNLVSLKEMLKNK